MKDLRIRRCMTARIFWNRFNEMEVLCGRWRWSMMPGDTVTLLNGRYNDNHNTGWMAPMDNLVGKSFVIQEVRTNPSYPEYYEYKLEGDDSCYWYDEAWLSLVAKQPTISDGEISMFLDDF